MSNMQPKLIDMHVHVGRIGKIKPEWGHMTDWYRRQTAYRIFLLYLRLDDEDVTDNLLRKMAIQTIDTSGVDQAVCLALDMVYDTKGKQRPDWSHIWVSNEYVLELQKELPKNILLGASVHPFDPEFKTRVRQCVDSGAVLLKWLPSAQQIDLADSRVLDALKFLAVAKNGKPLPLLLHVGPEYAIMSSDPRTTPYDYLSWNRSDKIANFFRFSEKWFTPNFRQANANLRAGLDDGAWIIFAHGGFPYFASGWPARFFEHDESSTVRDYVKVYRGENHRGRCFADISAFCTPFRQRFFESIAKLPPESLLYGSDFPTPAFELSADTKECMDDLKAVLNGEFDRLLIPEDNLLDVNLRELQRAFPGHRMFTNFSSEILQDHS
jgi:predicted TIM-barrel fold metal-dependent hydrolase